MEEETEEIKCIFFSEFHLVAGPKLTYQTPEDFISKEEFDTVHVYIIAKPELQNKVITINALGHKIVGCPVCIDNPKYARNALMFNLCFTFDALANTHPYEAVVKKLAGYFTTLELEYGFLSKEESKVKLPGILADIRNELNTLGTCCIPVDASTAIHLKIVSDIQEPPPVANQEVPVIVSDDQLKWSHHWDIATQQLLPYMDGFHHIARIAAESDVDINIVKACVQNLVYKGIVKLISIFQYSNVYVTTTSINKLWENQSLQGDCIQYVCKQGHPLPVFRDVFKLYCGLKPGTTVRDLCARYNPHSLGIDERKLIQFGLMKGLIRRLHKYPVKLASETGSLRLRHLYKWFNGCHSYDEICCHTGMSYNELDEKIENDPSTVVCWK